MRHYTPEQIAEVGRILAAARAEARKHRRPATPAPPFPRRTIVADYCRTCGRTSGCWQGCAGGVRVYWHDRPVSATMDGKSDARSTDSAVRHSGHLEQKEPAPMRHVTHTVNPSASQAT